MGEHKIIKNDSSGNGDGLSVSTHIVEVGDFAYVGGPGWGPGLEAMYTRLAERAKSEDSFILNTVQTVSPVVVPTPDAQSVELRIIVCLTAQRISRTDLERQQRLQRMGAR